jgi:hypothetical protein
MSQTAPDCFIPWCTGKRIGLWSIRKRMCSDCGMVTEWELTEGQISTLIENLTFKNQVTSKEELKQLGCTIHEDYEIGKADRLPD